MKKALSESELRDLIWNDRENWSSMVLELPPEVVQLESPAVEKLSPEDLLWRLVVSKTSDTHQLVKGMALLGKEVQVEVKGRGRMSMDLFGTPFEPGSPGLCVVELKISADTSRQSFTELLGYGNGLRLHFPGLCRDDVILVLVAPMSSAPRIVQNSVASFLAFDHRPILVLEPLDGQDGSLRLRPWLPERGTLGLLGRAVFSYHNFDVVQQVWEEDDGWWTREQLMGVAASAALKMESSGIHGFTYCYKSYPDAKMILPNSLVCVGLNPYRVASRMLHAVWGSAETDGKVQGGGDLGSASVDSFVGSWGIRISDVLPGLRSSDEAGTIADDLDNMQSVWSSHLEKIAWTVRRRATKRSDGQLVMSDRGVMSFADWVNDLVSDVWVDRTPVRATGSVRELWELAVEIDYDEFEAKGEHPIHGDIYRYAGETLGAHVYFREFLRRMMREAGSLGDIADYEE